MKHLPLSFFYIMLYLIGIHFNDCRRKCSNNSDLLNSSWYVKYELYPKNNNVRFLVKPCDRSISLKKIGVEICHFHRNGKVVGVTALAVTGDEICFQRQWRPRQSFWRPFRFIVLYRALAIKCFTNSLWCWIVNMIWIFDSPFVCVLNNVCV